MKGKRRVHENLTKWRLRSVNPRIYPDRPRAKEKSEGKCGGGNNAKNECMGA
jgi:hypothetical protein